jgi:hypothetical protein
VAWDKACGPTFVLGEDGGAEDQRPHKGWYSPEQVARFEVHVEKARTLLGEGALPFEAVVRAVYERIRKAREPLAGPRLAPPIFHQGGRAFRGRNVRSAGCRYAVYGQCEA